MPRDTRTIGAQVATTENVHVRVHDAEQLREAWPGWEKNPKWVKRKLAARTPPDEEHHASNTTTVGLNELIPEVLHPGTTVSETASHLALGTGMSDTASGDRSLESEVYRVETTDDALNGTELYTSTLLDTSEANGNDLTEVGLVTSDTGGADRLLNHAPIGTIEKTANSTATIDVTLRFESV